ncbi:MAG TPA: UvrD-helicase domain-containing protein [Candidatus Paceibacterota bacterium]|nr:UvrD-helicase domain-containing protein [Candidatus Paceibacterota bacterium]
MQHLEGLNEAQKSAVLTTEGPLLVLAGAGSGKTRVITHRIIHLILNGVAPHHILAVTFTNKAAKEMRERVTQLLERYPASQRAGIDTHPLITTFHALGVRILREQHDALGLRKHFTIYDRSDSLSAIKKALEKANFDAKQFEPRTILSIISRAKGDARTQIEFSEEAKSYPEKVAAETWRHYDAILKSEHALDFDDLLAKTLHLLKGHPHILTHYQDRFHYVHIDEYQDTNRVQFEIARLLVGERANLCVVGDVDQNIYSWRGADIKNILQFEKLYPRARIVMLEENYRSTKTIIAASNDIIEKNVNRPLKNVFTNNHDGEPISLYVAMSGNEEAEHIALTIKEHMRNGVAPSEIAILFRTNFQSRVLEEACINYGVPYQMLGTRFFDRKEIKDMLAYLRLAFNPDNTTDLARIINTPARGIGKITVLKIVEGQGDTLPKKTLEKVHAFYAIIHNIHAFATSHPIHETLAYILTQSGLDSHYKESGDEGLERLENVRELVTLGTKYAEYEPEVAIEHLLEDAALGSDQDELKDKGEFDAVRLMTIHASKGLEFPYVFITGLEEGLFPHERLGDERVDEEEERRLFYVALTRAQKKVYLSHAHIRTIFGSQRVQAPSSFLYDLKTDYLEQTNPTESGYERTVYLD